MSDKKLKYKVGDTVQIVAKSISPLIDDKYLSKKAFITGTSHNEDFYYATIGQEMSVVIFPTDIDDLATVALHVGHKLATNNTVMSANDRPGALKDCGLTTDECRGAGYCSGHETAKEPMTADSWISQHPNETHEIYETLTRRMMMKSWADLHPVANQFQRKIVIDLAHDVINVVVGAK